MDKASFEALASQHRDMVYRIALAAALILALSVTAYATELFGLMDFILPDQYQSSTLPDDAADNASYRQQISLSGFNHTPEAKASAEWKQYYNAYDFNTVEWDKDDLPQHASYYGAYNQEMYDKLKEIAAKYDLELLDNVESGSRNNHTKLGEASPFYQYSSGTFKEECTFIHEDKSYNFSLIRNVKGYLPAASFEIWDAENWETWNYATPQGYEVAICLSGELFDVYGSNIGYRGLILTDLGDSFAALIMVSWDEPIPSEAMQAAAEFLDYARLAVVE